MSICEQVHFAHYTNRGALQAVYETFLWVTLFLKLADGATPMPTTMRVANVMDENPHKRVVRCRHLRVRAQLPGLGLGLGLESSPLSL